MGVIELDKIKSEKSNSSTSEAGVTTTAYSKRANRGHNPKYEQDSFVSFCGSKKKHPE